MTGNYKRGSSVTEMKKGAGVGIIGEEKESEQGLHFTSSPMESPCHTNANDSAPGPPLIKTQSIYSNSTNKNCLSTHLCPELSLIGTTSPYTSKKLKTKRSLKQLLPNISASNQFSQQRNCTNPTRSTPFRGVE